MLMRDERLAGLQTHFEDDTHLLTIRENGKVAARREALETAEGLRRHRSVFRDEFRS